jgi:hypothetical protein
MSALVVALLLNAGPCFEIHGATAGWKRVELEAGSSLAVFEDVPQFRTEASVILEERQTDLYRTGAVVGGGADFELDLPPGTRAVQATFAEPLRGAKVDVTGWNTVFLREQRVRGSEVSFSWGDAQVRRVWIRVHHHFRKPPVLMAVQLERRLPPRELGIPLQSRSLYFFQPEAGMRLVLCEDPERRLRVTRASLQQWGEVASMQQPGRRPAASP